MELIIGKLMKDNISSQNQGIIFNHLNHDVFIVINIFSKI